MFKKHFIKVNRPVDGKSYYMLRESKTESKAHPENLIYLGISLLISFYFYAQQPMLSPCPSDGCSVAQVAK